MDELLKDLEWIERKYENLRPVGTMVAAMMACIRGSIHIGRLDVLYQIVREHAVSELARLRK